MKNAVDEWIMVIPDDVYDLCPCGCGTKWRYVVKGGEKSINEHFEKFSDQ